MRGLAVALALALASTAARAAPADDAVATVHQFIDAFNKGDVKAAAATHEPDAAIIDEVGAHQWHGPGAFQAWASGVQSTERGDGLLADLPPYAYTYDPTVIPQLGANLPKIDGITGAAGYYYGPGNPVTP